MSKAAAIDHLSNDEFEPEATDWAVELERLEVVERQSQSQLERMRKELKNEREDNWILAGIIAAALCTTAIAAAMLHGWQ
jgi:hypothetical protein